MEKNDKPSITSVRALEDRLEVTFLIPERLGIAETKDVRIFYYKKPIFKPQKLPNIGRGDVSHKKVEIDVKKLGKTIIFIYEISPESTRVYGPYLKG